jgi:NTP pyrophosphatase (non-canonical NTP hydrolase)
MDFETKPMQAIASVHRYGARNHITIDGTYAALKLAEEVGEFFQAIITHRRLCRPEKYVALDASRQQLASELVDIIALAIMNAHLLEVNLELAMTEKWHRDLR